MGPPPTRRTLGSVPCSNMAVSVVSSVAGMSSSQGLWSMINQFQMYLLVPIIGADIADDVLEFLEGMEFALFSFSFIPFEKILFLEAPIENFEFPQDNNYLDSIGLESVSTIANQFQLFVMLGLLVIFHLVFLPIFHLTKHWENKFPSYMNRVRYFLTFTAYVRFIVEAFILLTLSSLYEIYTLNFEGTYRMFSFIFSSIVFILCCAGLALIIVIWK
jgi:hypothetical protein